jgi:hypothetical protein
MQSAENFLVCSDGGLLAKRGGASNLVSAHHTGHVNLEIEKLGLRETRMENFNQGDSARQAKLCLWITLAGLAVPALVTPLGGDVAIAAWTIGGTLAFICGISAVVFRHMAAAATTVQSRAGTMSGLILDWTYSRQEWQQFADAEWDREHGAHFRIGMILAGLFGGVMGGMLFTSWSGVVLGGIAGVVFGWCLKGVNRAFLRPGDVAAELRMNDSRLSFGEIDFTLGERDCHLQQFQCDDDQEPPVLEFLFGDVDGIYAECIRLPVPAKELGRMSVVVDLLERKIAKNESLFGDDDENADDDDD